MKQKKFKIKSQTLVKFKNTNSSNAQFVNETEVTTATFMTTTNSSGIFNK